MKAAFNKLIASNKLVLIDFHATWCGPCKAMSPRIKSLVKKMKGEVKVIKIDIDRNKSLSHNLKIKGVPTFMLYKNGRQLWRQSGMMTENELLKIVKSNL
jgi:thioredoxin 1